MANQNKKVLNIKMLLNNESLKLPGNVFVRLYRYVALACRLFLWNFCVKQMEKNPRYFKTIYQMLLQNAMMHGIIGFLYMSIENYHEAVDYFQKGLQIAQETGDKKRECDMCSVLGEAKRNQGQFKESIRYFNKALVIARSNGLQEEEAWTLVKLAYLYIAIEKYHEAVDYSQKCLPIAQKIGDKKLECEVCKGLGGAYRRLRQYNDGMKYSKKALESALSTGDSILIASSYCLVGTAYTSLSEYHNSIKCYNKAINMCKQLGHENGLQTCYSCLSRIYLDKGKYNDAIYFQEEALSICDKIGNKIGKANLLLSLGVIHSALKNSEKAVDFYQQSLTIAKEFNLKSTQGSCYEKIGNALISSNIQDAISCYLKSRTFAEELDDKHLQAMNLLNIGRCFKILKQYQMASKFYNSSLKIANKIKDKQTQALVYFFIADFHYNIGEFQQAIIISQKSLDIASSINNKQREGHACYQLGEIYHSLAKNSQEHETHVSYMAKSEEYLKEAMNYFDYLFSQLSQHDQFKISIFDNFIETYKLLTTVYIETQQTQQALLVSDRGRARALGDRLIFKYSKHQEEYLSSKPLTYADVEKVLSNDAFTLLHYSLLGQIMAVCVLSKDSITVKETEKKIFDSAVKTLFGEKKKEQEDIINRFFTDIVARAYEDMKIKEGVTCENRSLDDCMTPIDQQHGMTESLSRDGTNVEEPGQESQPLEVLYNALIAPVMAHVQHDEVVIVPDGKMYTVPFAALIDPNTGQYLSQTKRIRLLPSISILKVLQECPTDHHSQQGALIVGNPRVGEVMFRGKKKTFGDLRSAQMEAKCISRLLDNYYAPKRRNANYNFTLLTGKQATKDVVLEKMKEGVAIIHIAAHGSPYHGEIALAPIASQVSQGIPDEQDYLLTMKEVQQVGVRAQLVVLSCCHSGRGEIKAEGIVGLSRGFLAAGAKAVVASLWAIDDYVTLSFMVSFYECLCQGKSASVSLDKAMKDIRKDHSDPKYWAPFFLIGDDVTIKL